MDSMESIVGIEVAVEELRLVAPRWLKELGIGFEELAIAELGQLAVVRLVVVELKQLAADSFELLAISSFGQLFAIGLEQLVPTELERLAFDTVGFAKLEQLSTTVAVLDTEHIIEHKHSMDTIAHTAVHKLVVSEHLTINTEQLAEHITTIGHITVHTVTTSSVHTIMVEPMAGQQQEFVVVAVDQSTMNTAIAIAFAFGIAVDSTVAIAERMEIGID